jgi:subtilisin family serine protease
MTRIGGSTALSVTGLDFLMARGEGNAAVRVALVDGPCDISNPVLSHCSARVIGGETVACKNQPGPACTHATYVASILFGRRDSEVAGICPGCSFLLRPIYHDQTDFAPRTSVQELARAIADCLDAEASVIVVSSSARGADARSAAMLSRTLDLAAARQILVVAAAGNENRMGGSPMTQHPWVTPVVAVTLTGEILASTNLGLEMARNGVAAPGIEVRGYHPENLTLQGSSIAVPLVAGALALLCSEFSRTSPSLVRAALRGARPRSVVPPILDARSAYQRLAQAA